MSSFISKPKAVGFRRAIDMLGRGSMLMLMHDNRSPHGKSYYLVPGGYVEPDIAEKLIAQPNVMCNNDGLMPETPQFWSIAKAEHV